MKPTTTKSTTTSTTTTTKEPPSTTTSRWRFQGPSPGPLLESPKRFQTPLIGNVSPSRPSPNLAPPRFGGPVNSEGNSGFINLMTLVNNYLARSSAHSDDSSRKTHSDLERRPIMSAETVKPPYHNSNATRHLHYLKSVPSS